MQASYSDHVEQPLLGLGVREQILDSKNAQIP
jgi:hypothetical protein